MKNKKSLIAVAIAIVVVIIIALCLVLGGKDNTVTTNENEVDTVVSTDVVTNETVESNAESSVVDTETKVEDDTDYLAGIGEAPEDTSSDNEVIGNDEPTKDFVDGTEPVEGNKDEVTTTPEPEKEETPVIVPGDPTTDDGTGNGGGESGNGGNSGNSGNSGNGGSNNGGTNVDPNPGTTPEPTNPPTTTPEPTNPTTPSAGDNLNYNNSITLPSGAKLPILNEFNTAGLDPNNSFWGDWNSQIVADNFETYINALEDVENAWGTSYASGYATNQNFHYSSNSMQWYMGSFDNYASIEVKRDSSQYYTLCINCPLDTNVANQLGWTWGDMDTNVAREALTCLLATISSDPQTLTNTILEDLYGDTCIKLSTEGWTSVGDCKMTCDAFKFSETNGTHVIVYFIKP